MQLLLHSVALPPLLIDKLESLNNNDEFKFSIDKTNIVHLLSKCNLRADPQLTLYNHPVTLTKEFKFLDMYFTVLWNLLHIGN